MVTGAASGIGLGTARELAAHGASVAVADIARDRAEDAAASIAQEGGVALGFPVEVASRPAVENLFGKVEAELGPVDIPVNNAGVSIDRGVRRITDAE